MAWLSRVGDLWAGRKARIDFEDYGEEETLFEFASPSLDIDLTESQPPLDFLSSSLDLMQGLTVTEVPFDALPPGAFK